MQYQQGFRRKVNVLVLSDVCDNFLARLKVRDCENGNILSKLKYEPQKSQIRRLFEKFQRKNAIKRTPSPSKNFLIPLENFFYTPIALK